MPTPYRAVREYDGAWSDDLYVPEIESHPRGVVFDWALERCALVGKSGAKMRATSDTPKWPEARADAQSAADSSTSTGTSTTGSVVLESTTLSCANTCPISTIDFVHKGVNSLNPWRTR